jgi:hypothetical protein
MISAHKFRKAYPPEAVGAQAMCGTVENHLTPVFITLGAQAHGDTAEPVPFVGRFIPQAPVVNEKLL